MNSKDKGNIGESKILYEFIKRGIQVSIPFGDNARYDLIADFGGKLNKIQVKYYDQQIRYGGISVPCASSTNHTTNKGLTDYIGQIDYFVFVNLFNCVSTSRPPYITRIIVTTCVSSSGIYRTR